LHTSSNCQVELAQPIPERDSPTVIDALADDETHATIIIANDNYVKPGPVAPCEPAQLRLEADEGSASLGPPGARTVQIFVEDVAALRAELVRAGASSITEIVDQDWGNLEMTVIDPGQANVIGRPQRILRGAGDTRLAPTVVAQQGVAAEG